MTVGIYIRVSTLEQALEGHSIGAQKERLIAYCHAQGWDDFKLYVDEGVSAKDTNRPKLKLLLEDVKKQRINMILVYRLDRFTRSVADLYRMLQFLDDNKCAFKSATEIYDTSSAMGRMFIGLVALLAQWETENLSERIKMALEKKVSDGERVGNVPFGFDMSTDEKLVKNADTPRMLEIVEKIESGWSLNRTANYLNIVDNSRIWRANSVLRLVRNPALYGATRWVDKIFEDTHEGIVTKERYLRLQQILDDRAVHFRKELPTTHLFQGIIACENCGSILSVNRFSQRRQDGTEHVSAMYRCNQCWKDKRISVSKGERFFENALMEYMKNLKLEEFDTKAIVNDKEDKQLYVEIEQVNKRREKYQRAWAADLINDDEFEQRMEETRAVLNELNKKLNIEDSASIVNAEEIQSIIVTFNECFALLKQEEKRTFIQQFIRKIEFKTVPQPSKNKKYKSAKPMVIIEHVEFYT